MTSHKSFGKLLSAAAFVSLSMLGACGDRAVQTIDAPVTAGARIKFFNFGVNAPGVNFYANDTKMSAVLSATGTESTTGVVTGGVSAGGLYEQLQPGSYKLTAQIAAVTDKGLPISTVTTTLEDGKLYSYYISGIYNTTTKSADAFVVEDPLIPNFDYTRAYVRFVNASPNAPAMTLYAKNTNGADEGAIGGAVAYKAAGAFTAVAPGVYDLNTRLPGSATNAVTRTAVTFVVGRIYTITARGDFTVGGTTAANRAQLDNTLNR